MMLSVRCPQVEQTRSFCLLPVTGTPVLQDCLMQFCYLMSVEPLKTPGLELCTIFCSGPQMSKPLRLSQSLCSIRLKQ